MTIITFGSGDKIAFVRLGICTSSMGSDVHYTTPSYDNFYTKYGFVVPTNYEAIPYDLVMDNILPQTTETVERFENVCNYILVGRDSHIWDVSVMIRNDGNKLLHSYIYRNADNGWWLNVKSDMIDDDHRRLIGFLRANPDQDKVDAYFHQYHTGERLVWFSVTKIVAEIENRFPKDVPELDAQ